MKVVAITGYKPNELGIFDQKHPGIRVLKAAYRERMIRLIEDRGTEWFITSASPRVAKSGHAKSYWN
ncbi:SLOG family protein [Exiguobacterium sp. SL14]|nr:SLOG family protein [Exiguobacterium sp. SL14]MCY1690773.1 SLOG family protein [Exiguobacterium sp. SL14]